MRFHDALIGLLLLIGAVALVLYSRTIPEMTGQQYGPGVFPLLVGVALGLTALVLMVRALAAGRGQPLVEVEEGLVSRRGATTVAVVIGGIAFYLLAADWLGFLVVAPLVLLALFRTQRVGWVMGVTVAVGTSLVMHFAFYQLLRVPLPWGLLTPIAW